MNWIQEKAYAKINLSLDILRKRSDGYHEVSMVMQQVSLHDLIEVQPGKSPGITLTSNKPILPLNQNNLVYQAVELLAEHHGIDLKQESLQIHIDKRIPVAAGLAGGSADAAAAFRAMNRYWEKQTTPEVLADLGKKLGADVPYCLMGKTALAEGIGERLTPLRVKTPLWLVLVKPPFSASTAEVYRSFQIESMTQRPENAKLIQALESGNFAMMAEAMGNVLQPVTATMIPEVEHARKKLIEFNAFKAMMSGSGPTVFGLYKNRQRAERACEKLKRIYQETYLAYTIIK